MNAPSTPREPSGGFRRLRFEGDETTHYSISFNNSSTFVRIAFLPCLVRSRLSSMDPVNEEGSSKLQWILSDDPGTKGHISALAASHTVMT